MPLIAHSDLKAESDALQAWVFPHLGKLCTKQGACFQAIDLRWGTARKLPVISK
jgi:hypothetical protein